MSNQIVSSEGIVDDTKVFKSQIKINFPSSRNAQLVKSCLEVDDELQPLRLTRSIEVNDSVLEMYTSINLLSLILLF